MRKFNLKQVKNDIVIIQSLEGTPQLVQSKNVEADFVFFCHDHDEKAVKNQLLSGPDAYYVDQNYKEYDSNQLRKYFEDQKILVHFIQENYSKEEIKVVKS